MQELSQEFYPAYEVLTTVVEPEVNKLQQTLDIYITVGVYNVKEMTDDYGNEYFILFKVEHLNPSNNPNWGEDSDKWYDFMGDEDRVEELRQHLNRGLDPIMNNGDHTMNFDSVIQMNGHLVLVFTALK